MKINLSWLRGLPQNWDTYGASEIDEKAIRTAESLQFVPTTDGGVQIELHAGGADVEVTISPDGQVDAISMEKK